MSFLGQSWKVNISDCGEGSEEKGETYAHHVAFLGADVAGDLARVGTVGSLVIFLTAVAACSLLTIRTVLRQVFLRLADLAGTTSAGLALLSTVTDTMTLLATQEAGNDGLNTGHSLVWAAFGGMTELVAVAALRNATIERDASVGEASEVFFRRSRPLVKQSGTLSFLRGEVADCVFLADVALKIDVGPGATEIFLL